MTTMDKNYTDTDTARAPARSTPEPWRPSVDDWDLLPDVDPRRR